MWNNHPDWVWHLKIIDADKAWYITKGSSDIKIAVIDTWFDINHPDLEYKFTTTSDPMSGTTFSSDCKRNHHGTAVSSFAAAHTDGGGQLSSIGFNTMIKPYHWVNGLAKAHHASIVEGVDVISISWFSSCSPDTTGQDQLIIQEILDNGTTIVASAGNGYTGASCPIGGEPPFSPLYPFSPTYDDRLICVTSTDENDNHTFYMNGENKTHSHYPEVDICAPGYSVMGATSTEKEEDNGNCVPNTWPYHGSWSGTSFATPIVAGVAALIKSANNSVTPAQVKDIIKSTADPVNDAHLYPGMLGAGRINAYCAVYQSEPLFLSGSQSGSFERFFVNLDDVIVESGNNLQIKYNEINFTSEFEAELGAELLIEPGSNFSCP